MEKYEIIEDLNKNPDSKQYRPTYNIEESILKHINDFLFHFRVSDEENTNNHFVDKNNNKLNTCNSHISSVLGRKRIYFVNFIYNCFNTSEILRIKLPQMLIHSDFFKLLFVRILLKILTLSLGLLFPL